MKTFSLAQLDDEKKVARESGPFSPGLVTKPSTIGDVITLVPVWDECAQAFALLPALARHFEVSNQKMIAHTPAQHQTHNVYLGYVVNGDKSGFAIWCSDPYVESTPGQNGSLELDVEGFANAARQMVRDLSQMQEEHLIENLQMQLKTYRNMLPATGICSFWPKYFRTAGTYRCDHINHVLGTVSKADLVDIKDLAEELILGHLLEDNLSFVSELQQNLEEDAFRVPILLIGDAGGGKTHATREFAKKHNYPYFCIGGNSDTRPVDFTGHWIPKNGDFVWKDGKFTQAIRCAQHTKVVLTIDELYRIAPEHLSVLLTSLSPYDGHYVHETGRMLAADEQGVARSETLSCPVENLCIFATTNLGLQYGIFNRDPAIRRRFREIEVQSTAQSVMEIVSSTLKVKKYSRKLASKMGVLWSAINSAAESSKLAASANVAVLCRAVELSKNENDIANQLIRESLQWVNTDLDGRPNTEQLEFVKDTVFRIFGPKASTPGI